MQHFVQEYIHIQTNRNVLGQGNIHGVTLLSGQNGLWKTVSPLYVKGGTKEYSTVQADSSQVG